MRHREARHVPRGLCRCCGDTASSECHSLTPRSQAYFACGFCLAFSDHVVQPHATWPIAPPKAAPADGGISASPSPAGAALGVCACPASHTGFLSPSCTCVLPATCCPLSHLPAGVPWNTCTQPCLRVNCSEGRKVEPSPCQACVLRSSAAPLVSPLSQALPFESYTPGRGGVQGIRRSEPAC